MSMFLKKSGLKVPFRTYSHIGKTLHAHDKHGIKFLTFFPFLNVCLLSDIGA